jgi:putative transcriptional regulator
MQWNLRMVAAQRGIWRAADLRRLLAEAGLEISTGKMSYLWSGQPISVRLDDLDVLCQVLDCDPGELLVREAAGRTVAPGSEPTAGQATSQASGQASSIRPGPRRGRRSLPPV